VLRPWPVYIFTAAMLILIVWALMRGHGSGHGPRPRAVRRLSEIVRYTFSCEAAHRCTGLTTAGPGDRIGSGNRCESIFFES
jgi:hypothetical protein